VSIDYDALYQMPKPPEYKPFSFYGAFLFSVAKQQTPLAMDIARPTPDNVSQTMDVVFKNIDGIKLGLDVYRPSKDETPNPLILITHGGAWKAGDKALYRPYGIDFAALGYTVASINYRLSGQAPFPAAIEDIRDAIAYLRGNATKFNIDPERLVIFGSSAGGHLSAFTGLAANTPGASYLSGVDARTIKAIISIYGPHDLASSVHRNQDDIRNFIGKSYADAPELYREASPINHVDKNDPPVLLIHGTLDAMVPVQNSDALSQTLKEAGVPVTYDRIEGWFHVMDFFSPISERTLWQCYNFLKTHVPSDEMLESIKTSRARA
jgi:acetyl esterase/lipase